MSNREIMINEGGQLLTQSLFLEFGYDTDKAVYTLKEVDHEFNGKVYPSIKRLYLEMEDPTEYQFAETYFVGWRHWMRICDNKFLRKYVDEWREELEYKLRAKAVKNMLKSAADGNYQACKWLADRGWHTRPAGRPSKAEVEHEKKVLAAIGDEYANDAIRLFNKGS